jgi:small subunit ribosomal protein S1
MINKKREQERGMPAVDEGWWEAVLAEEGRHQTHRPLTPASRGAPRKPGKADGESHATRNWELVKRLFQSDEIVDLRVTACNRGGLLVEGDELSGFVPFSHLVNIPSPLDAADRSKLLDDYVGRTLRLKVIECVPDDGRIVFSERAAQAEPGKRAQIFQSLRPGERARGTVTNITDFGVFVDLGGVEGLIHISELSWGRVAHPNQIVQLGQNLEVEVLELSPERCRVALSLKRLLPNPWTDINSELRADEPVPAIITSVLSYGAFARLQSGVEGLIHVSEMPLEEGQAVKDCLHEGQAVTVRVLHVDAAHQRMGLSLKPAR